MGGTVYFCFLLNFLAVPTWENVTGDWIYKKKLWKKKEKRQSYTEEDFLIEFLSVYDMNEFRKLY